MFVCSSEDETGGNGFYSKLLGHRFTRIFSGSRNLLVRE